MISFSTISIRWKINLFIVLVSSIVLLLAGVTTFVNYRSQFRQSTVSELTSLARVIARSVDSALVFYDSETAAEILESLREKPQILGACVLDENGSVFARYNSTPDFTDFPLEVKSGNGYVFHNRILMIEQPVVLNNQRIGTLTIARDLTELQMRLNRFIVISGILITILLFVAFLLSDLLQRIISEPILHLTQTAKNISRDKNYSIQVEKTTSDEIGELIDSFNQMIREVKKRDDYLEDQVCRRTDDLQKAVNELRAEMRERRQTEQELRESEERFRNMGDNIHEGLTIIENDELVYFNDRICQIVGLSREKFRRSTLLDMAEPDERERISRIIEQKDREGIYPEEIECWIIAGDGTRRCILNRYAVLKKSRNVVGCFIVTSDITERKRMEEDLLRVKKLEATGILAGGIAHDFNNLLAAILGNLSLARDMLDSDLDASERLAKAERASLRIKDLIKRFVTFSTGGSPVKKLASLKPLVEDAVTLSLSGSSVTARFSLPDDLWKCEIDTEQIGQAVHVIIDNAKEAMLQGGSVTVSAENVAVSGLLEDLDFPVREGRYVKLCISDTGIGISEESMQKIFDPYYSTKQRGSQKGMGLGLSIAYSIIKKHSGYIYLKSKPDAGTDVFILLPAAQDQSTPLSRQLDLSSLAATAEPQRSGAQNTVKRKILIMDDEELLREVGKSILERRDFEVETASDGDTAIELFRRAHDEQNPFDAVILDLTIRGGKGGRETIRTMLEMDPNVKAVVASGYSSDPVMASFRDYGFRAAMQKPFTKESLLSVIENLFS